MCVELEGWRSLAPPPSAYGPEAWPPAVVSLLGFWIHRTDRTARATAFFAFAFAHLEAIKQLISDRWLLVSEFVEQRARDLLQPIERCCPFASGVEAFARDDPSGPRRLQTKSSRDSASTDPLVPRN